MARKCALALVGEQRHLETTRKFLRFELQFGSPRCVESVAAARIAEAIVALKGQAARSGIFHRKIGRSEGRAKILGVRAAAVLVAASLPHQRCSFSLRAGATGI